MVKNLKIISSKMCACCMRSAELKLVDTETNEQLLLCRHHFYEFVDEIELCRDPIAEFARVREKVEKNKRKSK